MNPQRHIALHVSERRELYGCAAQERTDHADDVLLADQGAQGFLSRGALVGVTDRQGQLCCRVTLLRHGQR